MVGCIVLKPIFYLDDSFPVGLRDSWSVFHLTEDSFSGINYKVLKK